MEDPAKVKKIQKDLNSTETGNPWVEVNGMNIMPLVKLDLFGKFRVDPSTGYAVKLFVNVTTGEVKVFSSVKVEANSK